MTPIIVVALLAVAAVLLWAWRVRLDAVLGRRRVAAAHLKSSAAAGHAGSVRGSSAPARRPAPLINPHAVVRMRVDQDPNHLATCQTLWNLPDAYEPRGGGHA